MPNGLLLRPVDGSISHITDSPLTQFLGIAPENAGFPGAMRARGSFGIDALQNPVSSVVAFATSPVRSMNLRLL